MAYSAEFRQQVLDRARETGSFSAAAREFGVTVATVSRWCSAAGVSSEYADRCSPHGIKRFLNHGCRCASCRSAFADGLFMCIAYAEQGLTLEQIGEMVGVTRERVRQVINEIEPGFTSRVVWERKNEKELAALTISRCGFCGTMFAGATPTCSRECYDQREFLRYQFSDKYRDSTRRAIARWRLKNDDYGTAGPEHYERVLADPSDVNSHGRWLVRGCKSHTAAVKAYLRGGAVFEELPPPIQEQVREDARSLAA